MAKEKSDLEKLINNLTQQRDELVLQLHLGKKEAQGELAELEKRWEQLKSSLGDNVEETLQSEWTELEKKWEQLKSNEGPIRNTVDEVSDNVLAAVEMAGDELKRGYERLRKLL